MPWKECSVMDERLRFVARLLDGEAMSEVCRAFGISRKTGYKIFERYKEHGLEREAGRNVELMWLLGRLVPDHKALLAAISRVSRVGLGATRPTGELNPDAYQTNRRCEVTRKILCGPGSTRTSRVGLVGTINDLVDGERS
jgi:transposase-like protein